MILNILKLCLDLLYPPRCPGCGAFVEEQGDWCSTCFRSVWRPRMIGGSRNAYLDGCYTLGDYQGPLKKALLQLKFAGNPVRETSFAFLLSRFPWRERLEETDLCVPVPLSEKRKTERGGNQTDLIFQKYMEQMGKCYISALIRIRDTPPQHRLGRQERQKNLRMAFCVPCGEQIKDKKILLLDVMTLRLIQCWKRCA